MLNFVSTLLRRLGNSEPRTGSVLRVFEIPTVLHQLANEGTRPMYEERYLTEVSTSVVLRPWEAVEGSLDRKFPICSWIIESMGNLHPRLSGFGNLGESQQLTLSN